MGEEGLRYDAMVEQALRSVVRRPTGPVSDLRWWRVRKEALLGAAAWGLLPVRLEGRAPGPGLAACLSQLARRPAPDPARADFLARALELYRKGLAELYPGRSG